MKYLRLSLIVGIVISLLIRCSGPKVIAFTGNSPDFASYYTYRIKHPGTPDKKDVQTQQFLGLVENAIGNQMDARGYENTDVADIVISYNLILDNQVEYRVNNMSRYSYRNYPYGYNNWFDRDEYTEGTLLVELKEELTKRLIWQASLDMKYNKRSSSKRKRNPVENAFSIIFSKYPYIAGNSEPQIMDNQ